MKFIDVLHRGRKRRTYDPAVQERLAWYTLHPARNVKAAPQHPPVRRGGGYRNG